MGSKPVGISASRGAAVCPSETPEIKAARYKAWREKNLEYARERSRRWAHKNVELCRQRSRNRRRDKPEAVAESRRRYYLEHRFTEIADAVLRKKKASRSVHIEVLLGCTIEEFRAHLESLFKTEMTWENHGIRGWHIDHIRPVASFDLTDPDQQKACFHFTNLQPLWWIENLKKGSSYGQ